MEKLTNKELSDVFKSAGYDVSEQDIKEMPRYIIRYVIEGSPNLSKAFNQYILEGSL